MLHYAFLFIFSILLHLFIFIFISYLFFINLFFLSGNLMKFKKVSKKKDEIKDRAWLYQACNEFGHFRTSENSNSLFAGTIPLKFVFYYFCGTKLVSFFHRFVYTHFF